jgi:hypothetical protein
LKIAILSLLALWPTSLKLSAVGHGVKNIEALLATALKNYKHCRRQQLKYFTAVANIA